MFSSNISSYRQSQLRPPIDFEVNRIKGGNGVNTFPGVVGKC